MSTSTPPRDRADASDPDTPTDDGPVDNAATETAPDPPSETAESESSDQGRSISTQQQMQFSADGELEPKEDAVATTLEQFDVDISNRDPETRIDRPEASGLLKDDRPEVTSNEAGEQSNLFADAEEDQQTLNGNDAHNRCLFDHQDN